MADAFDYIVVGSGAGGGTLAARLAEAGRSVLLLEAGGDPRQLSGTNDYQPGINRLPDDYDVPAFHGFASENDAMRWDFFVRHYTSDAMQQRAEIPARSPRRSGQRVFSTHGREPWADARPTMRASGSTKLRKNTRTVSGSNSTRW